MNDPIARHFIDRPFIPEARFTSKPAGFGADGPGFDDLLDVVNPLQHLPVIGTLYRAVTDDVIAPTARVLGGGLYGGPIGLIAAVGDQVLEAIAGTDVGETVLSALGVTVDTPGDAEPAAELAVEASSPSDVAPATPDAATPAGAVVPAAVAAPRALRAAPEARQAPPDAPASVAPAPQPAAPATENPDPALQTEPTPAPTSRLDVPVVSAEAMARLLTSQEAAAAPAASGAVTAAGKPSEAYLATLEAMRRNLEAYERGRAAAVPAR
ncbi:MAG: hypothetical protein GC199_01160 [Alphaproteobacteria bacterium]|nr:hypothetical protein [Alphaproteobacteria bacterium]